MGEEAAGGRLWAEAEGLPSTGSASAGVANRGAPRVKAVDREQMIFRAVDVDHLIEEDHPARAIWTLVGGLDLGRFYAPIQAVEGVAGRPAWDPHMMISLWIYAYSRGIGSAREVARRCAYEPPFQWLTGLGEVNHHTLSDFRVGYQEALDELFVNVLGLMSVEGLITLSRVMHDGTKIRASAGSDSFRREARLRAHVEAAREQVAAMGDPRAEASAGQRAARARAARERAERVEAALLELERIREAKAGAEAKEQARASETDPEARIMKEANGGYAPGYNVQLSTDAAHGIIVGVGVSQTASDYGELIGAVAEVEENLGERPQQVVVDGGFTCRENILAMDEAGVDLIGSWDEHTELTAGQMRRRGVAEAFYPSAFVYDEGADVYRCPAGQVLRHEGREERIGVTHHVYRASASACAACPFKGQCCPQNETKGRSITRAVESRAVARFIEKMRGEAAKAVYRLRGAVAEFPNAWIKAKLGVRQFRVRGRVKVRMEAVWACLTYNVQQWIRLRWRRPAPALAR